MHDIDLTCEEPLDPVEPKEPRFVENEELAGCWRTFFRLSGIVTVLIIALIGYMVVAVWQPWETRAEKAAEELAAEIALIPPMPDVVGVAIFDVAFELDDDYGDVFLFDMTHHATKVEQDMVQKTDINVGQLIMATVPPAGVIPTGTVSIWIGGRPDVPAGVPADSFWYDHAEDVRDRGTGPCLLQCHTTLDCESCHELRLRSASSPFLTDPEDAPQLARRVSEATDIPIEQVLAVYQGIGWYRIDIIIEDSGTLSEEVEAAREAAVTALPAAYASQDDAEVIVFRWMVTGVPDPVVEIGLERETYEQIQWMGVEASDIPWVVDRFAVDSE